MLVSSIYICSQCFSLHEQEVHASGGPGVGTSSIEFVFPFNTSEEDPEGLNSPARVHSATNHYHLMLNGFMEVPNP